MRDGIKLVRNKFRGVLAGWYTPWEFFLYCFNSVVLALTRRNFFLHAKARGKRLKKKYLVRENGHEHCSLKGARLPLLEPADDCIFWGYTFEDTLLFYTDYDDCYDETKMAQYLELGKEGPYCLRNDMVDVTVKAGDVVLDAGSWIGDFAAYASAKGASAAYAFEPSDSACKYLLQTASLNKNIYVVKKGLGNVKVMSSIEINHENPTSNRFVQGKNAGSEERLVEITTIDSFVQESNLARVDFIKADIEGYERYMLEGAKETLKKFAPKLAICTYHLPDDPEVLAGIIKNANPAYYIVQKKAKLYASVPTV